MTLPETTKDNTIIFGNVSLDMMEVANRFDLTFKDTSLAKSAGPLTEKEKEETFCFVIPTTSWNLLQKRLQKLVTEENRRILGTARCYRIRDENLITKNATLKNNDKEIPVLRFMAMLDLTYNPKRYEFEDTLYLGYCSRCYKAEDHSHHSSDLDVEKYPLVIATVKAWDLFQRLVDQYGIREEIRQNYPVCMVVKHAEAYQISQQQFEKIKKQKNEQ